MRMRRILILTTGGTIASRPSEDGLKPGDIQAAIYDRLVEFAGSAKVEVKKVFSKDSSNIVPGDWKTVEAAIRENLPDYHGIVILHGTDTMSYSAAMLSYLFIGVDKPIVLTGSQLPMVQAGSDAPANLHDAVITAADERLAGVFVVFHDKVINGTRSYKRSSVSFDAYLSCNYPYVGVIKDGRLYLTWEYGKMREQEASGEARLAARNVLRQLKDAECRGGSANYSPRIFLLKMVPGFDPALFCYLEEGGYKGIVIEGFGLGGLPMADPAFTEGLERLTSHGIPAVMATQCVYDGVNLDTYEVGVQAERLGLISAFDMTSEAVYTKLMWILSMTQEYALIRTALGTSFCGEIRRLPIEER